MTYTFQLEPLDADGKRGGSVLQITRAPGGDGFVLLEARHTLGKKTVTKALGVLHVSELVHLANAIVAATGGAA